jgi:hypothetical protein
MPGTFQQAINYDFGFGIPGEIVRDGPLRSHIGYLNTAGGVTTNNAFGNVFTLNGDGKTVGAGGTGDIWGILANPKQHVSLGNASGPLAPVFILPNNVTADFVQFAKIVVPLYGTKAAAAGLQVQYAQATGQISIPATAGTPDANCTLLNAWVEDYGQSSEGGALILLKTNL